MAALSPSSAREAFAPTEREPVGPPGDPETRERLTALKDRIDQDLLRLRAELQEKAKTSPQLAQVWKYIQAEREREAKIYDPKDPAFETFWHSTDLVEIKTIQNVLDGRGFPPLTPSLSGNQRLVEAVRAANQANDPTELKKALVDAKVAILGHLSSEPEALLVILEKGRSISDALGDISSERRAEFVLMLHDTVSISNKSDITLPLLDFFSKTLRVDLNSVIPHRAEQGPPAIDAIYKTPQAAQQFLQRGMDFKNIPTRGMSDFAALEKLVFWGNHEPVFALLDLQQKFPSQIPSPQEVKEMRNINFGWNLLHEAALSFHSFSQPPRNGYPQLVQRFLDAGVSPFEKDANGFLPIELVPLDFARTLEEGAKTKKGIENAMAKNEVSGKVLKILLGAMQRMAHEQPELYLKPYQEFVASRRGQAILFAARKVE